MTTITAILIEQGNGLPRDGETVYDNDTETLYRVLSTGAIFTGDARGNYVHAQLEETGDDVTDLTDAEFAEVSDALVIDVRREEEWTLTVHGEGEHPETITGDDRAATRAAAKLIAKGDYDLGAGEEVEIAYHLTSGDRRIDGSVVVKG